MTCPVTARGDGHPVTGSQDRPVLRAISPDASPEEVAAIVAAITACTSAAPAGDEPASGRLDEWVRASRLRARRVGCARGSWRFSARVGRRTRP